MGRRHLFATISCVLLITAVPGSSASGQAAEPPKVCIVCDQAAAAIAILEQRQRDDRVSEPAWSRLWDSEGYRRLDQRQRSFGDEGLQTRLREYLLSDDPVSRLDDLRAAVARWRQLDVGPAASRAAQYLPKGLAIRASVYPVVKRRANSFVFDLDDDPAIFMYLDPQRDSAQLQNTLAHELHHVGSAACPEPPDREALSGQVRRVLDWLSAFGEGMTMLAAAGGPDVHPHQASDVEQWLIWERDISSFNEDLPAVEAFFTQALTGELPEEEQKQMLFSFINTPEIPQGAFYTVGWKMAAIVDRARGREALLPCVCDPRLLLRQYNEIVAAQRLGDDGPLPLWSAGFLEQLTPE